MPPKANPFPLSFWTKRQCIILAYASFTSSTYASCFILSSNRACWNWKASLPGSLAKKKKSLKELLQEKKRVAMKSCKSKINNILTWVLARDRGGDDATIALKKCPCAQCLPNNSGKLISPRAQGKHTGLKFTACCHCSSAVLEPCHLMIKNVNHR